MKSKRLLKILGIALVGVTTLSIISPINANAAWKQNSTGWWYTEGNSWSVGWRQIDGVWYYFDSNGYMKTGWVQDKGAWYYLDKSGAMKTGWISDNGEWYYLDASGVMKTGWVYINGKRYYLDKSGAMKTGWIFDDGNWYKLSEDGSLIVRRWIEEDGERYYVGEEGVMWTGWGKNCYGEWMYFGESGAVKTGWLDYNGDTYYLLSSGTMVTGWYRIDDKKYYFTESGNRASGIEYIDGVPYYFNPDDGSLVKDLESQYVTTDAKGRITKLDVEGAKEYILANDSDYINNRKKSEYVKDVNLRKANLSNISNFFNRMQGVYNIENEDCLVLYCMDIHETYESEESIYLLGLKSGKIYSADSHGLKEVYEIKDNKKVAVYADKYTKVVANWR